MNNNARQLIIKEEFDNFLFDMEKNKTNDSNGA